jgi:hypothetical protein
MSRVRTTLVGWLIGRVSRLRFPVLFVITGVLFLVNLVVPDAIPLVDEILLGLATAALASWRKPNLPEAAGGEARGAP